MYHHYIDKYLIDIGSNCYTLKIVKDMFRNTLNKFFLLFEIFEGLTVPNILSLFISQLFSFDVLIININVKYECITIGMINNLLFKEVPVQTCRAQIFYYYNRKKP